MVEDDIDEPEESEETEQTCPACRSDMEVRILAQKTDPHLDLSWAKMGWYCYDCGHQGQTWETMD
jgi:C4-type Zn-finger protein